MTIVGTPFSNDLIRMALEQKNALDDRNLRAAMADREAMLANKDRALRAQLAQQEMGLRQQEMGLKANELDQQDERLAAERQFTLERDRLNQEAESKLRNEMADKDSTTRQLLLDRELAHKKALADAELESPQYKAAVSATMAQTAQREAAARASDAAVKLREAQAENITKTMPYKMAQIDAAVQASKAKIEADKAAAPLKLQILRAKEALMQAQAAATKSERLRLAAVAKAHINEVLGHINSVDGSALYGDDSPLKAAMEEMDAYLSTLIDDSGAAKAEEGATGELLQGAGHTLR